MYIRIFLFLCFIFFKIYAVENENLEARLNKYIKFNQEGANLVGYIKIGDKNTNISQATWLYVKQALAYYQNQKNKPIFIILELNTPGGEIFPAEQISDGLKEIDTQYGIPIVTFINNWAISAGALLAYSTRFIAITSDASMGAAQPVLSSSSGELKEASEKVNSALRADFANKASFFNRNPYIAQAMVDKDLILIKRNDEIVALDSESQIKSEPNPDKVISPKGKLLTLNAQQLMEYDVADILLQPTHLELATPDEKETGKWSASKMLLFQHPYFAKIPNAIIDEYKMDWKTKFFVFLATPVVTSILMLGLMLGAYVEISTPGFGLPGTIALICLFLIVLSSLSLEIANWLEIILLGTGIVIILVDIFILPTFGLLGFFGVLLALAGLFGMLLPELKSVQFDVDTKTLNDAGIALLQRLAWLSGTILLGVLMMILLGRFITPRIASWSRLVLHGSEQEGYIAGENPSILPPAGSKGIVLSTLRPAGKVLINDKIYDALTAGNFIEKNTSIVVSRLEGSVIIVDEEQQNT